MNQENKNMLIDLDIYKLDEIRKKLNSNARKLKTVKDNKNRMLKCIDETMDSAAEVWNQLKNMKSSIEKY